MSGYVSWDVALRLALSAGSACGIRQRVFRDELGWTWGTARR
jgi:hypothetical protein